MTITKEQLASFPKGLKKRLRINGKTEDYQSYLIPLEFLFYNDMNGRISTYIEEYGNGEDSAKKMAELRETNINEYNDLIANYIKKSSNDNEKSFKETKDDIFRKGQQNPGVVLSDGRIIDGNRRFTAIRELSKEIGSDDFSRFEAVCLPAPSENDASGWKTIKTLELNLQFNVDEKRGYDRIDFLVSFYKDTMEPGKKRFEKNEYCNASGMHSSEYDKNVGIIKIMLDYLQWRGCPKAFYLLKREKLDGPIEEIANATKKMGEEEWTLSKSSIYNYMTHVQAGDKTRNVRELVKSAKNNGTLFNEFKRNIEKPELMLEMVELNNPPIPNTPEESAQLDSKRKAIDERLTRAYAEAKLAEVTGKCKPIEHLVKANNELIAITTWDVAALGDKRDEFLSRLDDLEKTLEGIKHVAGE